MGTTGIGECAKSLRCLICKQELPVEGFLFHVFLYFKYNRNHCNNCEFKTNSDEQATLHQVSTGHVVLKVIDSYIESLSSKILADCYKASNTAETPPTEEFVEPLPSPSTICPEPKHDNAVVTVSSDEHLPRKLLNESINSTTDLQQAKSFNVESMSLKSTRPNENEDLCVPINNPLEPSTYAAPVQTSVPVKKKHRTMKRNAHLLMPNLPIQRVVCKKCGVEIDEAYLVRRTHVLQNHCSSRLDPDIVEVLEAEMRFCFPSSMPNSDNQCTYCGKEFRGRVRRSHVLEKHFRNLYPCVITPCTVSYRDFAYLREHIAARHGKHYLSNKKDNVLIWNKLEQMRQDFVSSLEQLMATCFPYHFSLVKNSVAVDDINSRSSADDAKCLPRASACDKVADILKDVVGTRTFKAVERAVLSSSDSSNSDSDSDVKLIDEWDQEVESVKKTCATRFKGSCNAVNNCIGGRNSGEVASARNSQFADVGQSAIFEAVNTSCDSNNQNPSKIIVLSEGETENTSNISSLVTSPLQVPSEDFQTTNRW